MSPEESEGRMSHRPERRCGMRLVVAIHRMRRRSNVSQIARTSDRSSTEMSRRSFVRAAALGAVGALGMSAAGVALASESGSDAKDASTSSASGSASADGPYTIVDRMDREITFDSVPQRVAMTIMPLPSIFYSIMGNTDMIVGCNPASITAYEDSVLKEMYPELANAATDWCGTDFSVNVEELLKLEPDVVFQWTSQPESIEKMEEAGLKVVGLKYGTLEEIKLLFNLMGEIFHKEERVEFLMDYFDEKTAEVTDITSAIPQEEWPQAIELYGDMTVVGGGFLSYWIDGAGTINPATEIVGETNNVEVDMEQILVWNPDIIWIGNFTSIVASDLLENKLDGQDWSMVSAVQNGQVYKIPIGGYRWDPPSIESPLVLKWMAKIAHPEEFADVDMTEELKTFYQDIYDFELTDDLIEMILGDVQD